MDIGKYKQAMRPKKYLDGKFVIYDETMPDASDAQLETRENFAYGSVPGEGNSRIEYDPETNIYRKRVQETIDGKKTSKYIFSQPGQSLEDFKQTKPVRSTGAIDATVKARQYIDGWTKNWFDNNLKNYGVKDFEVMLNDLSNDWNEVLESADAPKASAKFNLSTPELNLPNITSGKDATIKKGSIEPFTYNDVRFYTNLEGSKDQLSKTLSQYKKVFYKNKIETDPQLRTGLNEFFDFMSADKRGLYKKLDGKTIKDFMNTVSDDVKFLLDAEISGLDKASKNKVFNSYDDLADNYNKFTQDKVRLKAVQAETEAIAKVGKKTADQYKKVKETIKKQNDVLAKMSVEDIAKNKKLLNSVRMVIDPKTGEVSYTNYTVKDPKGKPVLTDLELAEKIKQKAKNKNFFVTEHIGKKSLNKANLAFPNNIQSANYMSNSQLENARRFLINPENRNTSAAQNLDKALEQTGLTIRGSEYGGQRFGNKIDIVFDSKTNRSNLIDSQLINTKKPTIDKLTGTIPGVTTADKIGRPQFVTEGEVFKETSERWNQEQEINEILNEYCNVQKRAEGTGSLACSIEEVQNNIRGEARSALKTGKVGSKLGRLMSLGGKVFGLVDIPIELAFAMPHMLRGDKDAAKKAMIVGLFGAGRDKFERANEELGKDSATSKIYNFEKANEDFITAVTDAYNAKKSLDREDFEQLPNKIKQNAQKSLEENTEKAKSLYKVVNKNKPSLQNIIESKKELSDLQSKGTLGNFTYYGQGLDDNLNYYGGDVDLDAPIRAPYEGEDISKPTDFVEAQGDPMYPYQKEQGYLSKTVEDAYTGFTGKDILDRYSDVKLEDTQKLPEAEQDYLEQGFRELAMNIGPKATLKIMEEQGMDPSVLSGMFPNGYLERQGFSDGGMSRRGFLKLLGALGTTIGAAKTGLLKLAGKETTKQVTEQVVTPSNVEKIYLDLINVVKNKGILKRLDSDLETKVGEVYEYKGVKVLEDGENIELRFETDTGAPAVVEYRKPGYEVDPETGTSQQVPGEFIYEAQETARYGPGGDVDMDFVEEVIDPIDDVTGIADEVFETYVYKSPANRVPTTETQKAIRNKHLKEGGEHYSLSDETIDD